MNVSPQRRRGRKEIIFLFGGERPPNKKLSVVSIQASYWVPQPLKGFDLIPEGRMFLIQSPSPDWIRRKVFLSDLCVSAVNLILKEVNANQKFQ
jgi:hypothetical protein